MPTNVQKSLEALLRREIEQRVAAVKAATDEVITGIRLAAGRCVAELEHLADQIAAGEVEVEQHETGSSTPTPAAPAVPSQEPVRAPVQVPAATPGIARATWIPYGAPLPDYGSIGPAGR